MNLFGFDIRKAINPIQGALQNKKTSVLSEPTPAERGDTPRAPEFGEPRELVELVQKRVLEGLHHRRQAEREWVLAVAMVEGRQWLAWDSAVNRAISLMRDDETDRYVTHNLIKPLILKVIGLATMTKPDANVAPESDDPLDRQAASEARAITAHLGRLHKRPSQMIENVFWATVCGLVYQKEYWDRNAEVKVPSLDPNTGRMTKQMVKAGEVCSEVTPPFEVIVDARAKRWDKARHVIHYRAVTLAELEEMYGAEAVKGIEPDAFGGTGYIDQYMPEWGAYGGLSSLGFGANMAQKTAVLLAECWEKPSPRFPEGRLIVTTKTHLLYAGVNPLAKTEARGNPFARLVYQEAADHPYASGMVSELAPLQVNLNRLLTKATTETEDNKPTLIRTKIDGSGADAYSRDDIEEKRNFRTVFTDAPGLEARWQSQPNISADIWRMIDLVWLHMQHIAGIHDTQLGMPSGGVTAGVSIELLQQADKTQLGLFTQRIEQFAVDRDTLDIALYGKYATGYLPRLMGLDDSGNPETAQSRAMSFRALSGGGAVSVIVTPGSATPKTAAGQQQEILEYFKMGLFDPANPSAHIVLRLLSFTKSDQALEMMEALLAAAQAQQAQAQQAQMQQAQVQVQRQQQA